MQPRQSVFHRLVLVAGLMGLAGTASAQVNVYPPNVHILFDTSGSMRELPQVHNSDHNAFYHSEDPYPDQATIECNNTELSAVEAARGWNPDFQYPPPDLGTGLGTDTGHPNLFQDGKLYAYMSWGDSSNPTPAWSTPEAACQYQYPNTWQTTNINQYNACLQCLHLKGFYKRPGVNYVEDSSATTVSAMLASSTDTRPRFVFTGRLLNFNPPKYAVAKAVLKQTLKDLHNARVGLSKLSGVGSSSDGGVMVRPQSPACDQTLSDANAFDSYRATFINSVDALTFSGNTPLAKALLNIGQYFSTSDDVYRSHFGFTDYVYKTDYRNAALTSQSRSWCWAPQTSSVIIITDGLPTVDVLPATTLNRITMFNGGQVSCPTASDCVDSSGKDLKLDDVAKFLATMDLQDGVPTGDYSSAGLQTLKTYTIAYSLNAALLRNTALVGGGTYFSANDAESLRAALNDILNSVGAVP